MADFDLSRLVKPLEFAPDDDPDCITAGNYDIWHEGHGYQVYFWSVVCGEPYPTLAAAQAAAQAHHVARVIAALDAELLSELVGALQFYAAQEAWTQPPVEVFDGMLGPAYRNKASEVQKDRGQRARAAAAKLGARDV